MCYQIKVIGNGRFLLKQDFPDQFVNIRFVLAGDLTADNDVVILDQRFDSHAGMQIILHAVRNNSIRYLVGDFVRMSAGNLFSCE